MVSTESQREESAKQSTISVGFRTGSITDSRLQFIRRLGVTDVFLDHSSTDEEPGEFLDEGTNEDRLVIDGGVIPSAEELVAARDRVEDADLRFAGIHSLPYSLYGPIMPGSDEADKRIELVKQLLRNLGQADIPILGYQWNPRGLVPMRTRMDRPIWGGAEATEFDIEALDAPFEVADSVEREYTEEEFWQNYEQFVEAVVPVAEEAGVRMALHPVDPPGFEQLGGFPRLFRDVEAFERAMDIVPSDHHGLKLCLGCFSQLGEDIPSLIRRFGERGQIVFVHFRDVVGTVPSFHETFVDQGNFDEYDAMQALAEVGFDGAILPDHVPQMEGDSEWGHRGNAFTAGYLRGLIKALEH
ncbi:mannonate dehydratase [Halosimplex pelagicum]|uniref:mannonate dehydratase n=1 Tax=Halosimplex pelagicum TaxID=869886 RepID=A0A7D5P6G5_9EURY|nr:mannonate dehydratase [Halosimplex pelagicum]QLH82037.1 mannonate dehydratase [Halosimplex pelagicum]